MGVGDGGEYRFIPKTIYKGVTEVKIVYTDIRALWALVFFKNVKCQSNK